MELTPRLALAARLCHGGRRLIDVGCDHGHLSIWLVARGGFEAALACDLRPGPLARAAGNIAAAGLGGAVATRLSDGLREVAPQEGDTVAICGMGGQLMAAILAAAPWALEGGHRLVLQPQSRHEALRAFLAGRGLGIRREGLAREGHRLYCAMEAAPGGRTGEPEHHLFSRAMMDDPLFPAWLDRLIAQQGRVVAGRRQGGQACAREADLLARLEGLRSDYI